MDEWGEGEVTPFGMRADVVVVVQKKVGVLWPEKKRKARSERERVKMMMKMKVAMVVEVLMLLLL